MDDLKAAQRRHAAFDTAVHDLLGILGRFDADDRPAVLRVLGREFLFERKIAGMEDEGRLPPDTRGLVRVSATTRAGEDGRVVYCGHCGAGRRLFGFGGLIALDCEGCGATVERADWWTAPPRRRGAK